MALKYIDGFEEFVNGVAWTTMLAKTNSISDYAWSASSYSSFSPFPTNSPARTTQTNSASLYLRNLASMFMTFPANQTVIVGFGYRVGFDLTASIPICNFSNTSTPLNGSNGLHLYLKTNGALMLYNENNDTTIQTSAAGIIASYIWYYVEIKVSFGASATCEVRVNGTTVLNATGVNTLCGLTSVSGLNLSSSSGYYDVVNFDDFYICDTSGTTNNDFLGPLSVYTLFPSANGSQNDFTVQGAGSNYAAVNTQISTTTTYVQSGTTGAKDLYQMSDLPVTSGSVFGVMVRSYMQKLDNGTRASQLLIKTSGTEASSSNMAATMGTWLSAFAVFEKQADGTTAWDVTAVNAMEAGHKNS